VTISVRVAADSGEGTAASAWRKVSFTYYDGTTMTEAEAQAIGSAWDGYEDSEAAAQDAFDAALNGAEAEQKSLVQQAQATYDATLAAAGSDRQTQVESAEASYRGAVATAETAHSAAVTAAGDAFADALAAFGGDTTAYHLDEFRWADAPADNSLVLPSDDSQPKPPVSAPTYDGPQPALEADKTHEQALAQANKAYQDKLRQAKSAFESTKKQAKASYKADVAGYQQTYQGKLADADNAYQQKIAEIAQGIGAPVTLAQLEADRNAIEQFGAQAFREIQAIELLPPPEDWDPTRIYYTAWCDYEDLYEVYPVEEGRAWVPIEQQYSTDVATRTFTREQTLAEMEHAYADKLSANDAWKQTAMANAKYVHDEAVALARESLEKDTASAEQTRSNRLAEAAYTRSIAETNAQADLWQQQAEAKYAAVGRWASGLATPWANYQLALADLELKYYRGESGGGVCQALKSRGQTQADAIRAETKDVAEAEKTHDAELAAAQRKHTVDQAKALKDFQVEKAAKAKSLAEGKADAERDRRVGVAEADKDFVLDKYAHGTYKAHLNGSYYDMLHWERVGSAYGKKIWYYDTVYYLNEYLPDKLVPYMSEIPEYLYAAQALAIAEQGIDARYWDSVELPEEIERGKARSVAVHAETRAYQEALDLAEKEYRHGLADLRSTYEIAMAEAGKTYTTTVVAQDGIRDDAVAGRATTRTQKVAGAQRSYDDTVANQVQVLGIGQADAQNGFESGAASAYYDAVLAWDAYEDTPWSEYQLALAAAEVDRVEAITTARMTYQRGILDAAQTQSQAANGAAEAYTNAVAAASQERTESYSDALNTYAEKAAQDRLDYVTHMAQATTIHDKAIADAAQAHGDKLAREQEERDNAVSAADCALQLAEVKAEWEYASSIMPYVLDLARTAATCPDFDENWNEEQAWWEAVCRPKYEAQLEAIAEADDARTIAGYRAENAKWLAVAQAERDYALDVADAERAYVNDVGTAHVTFAGTLKSEEADLADDLKQAVGKLAGDRGAADIKCATTVGEAAKTQTTKVAQANRAYNDKAAGAGRTYNLAAGKASDTLREDSNTARGEYEIALYTAHAAKLQAISDASNRPIDVYQTAVAQADVTWCTAIYEALAAYHGDLTGANRLSALTSNSADVTYTQAAGAASEAYSVAMAEVARADSVGLVTAEVARTVAIATADAAQDGAERVAEAEYDRARVVAERTYNNSVAQAEYNETTGEAWAAWDREVKKAAADLGYKVSIAVLSVAHRQEATATRNALVTIADAGYEAAIPILADARLEARADAGLVYATDVGNAQVARATGLGDAGVQHATDTSQAEVDYTEALNVLAKNYVDKSIEAESGRDATLGPASATYANRTAQALRRQTHRTGWAEAELVRRYGVADVGCITTVAQAEAIYQVAEADRMAAVAAEWAILDGGDEALYEAARADALAAWTSAVADDFVTFATASAQADATYDHQIALAQMKWADGQAAADVNYAAQTQALARQYADETSAVRHAADKAQVVRDNLWYSEWAAADKKLAVESAKADKDYGVDLAKAEKGYQLGMVQGNPSAESERTAALTAAGFGRAVHVADARYDWAVDTLLADATLAEGNVRAYTGETAALADLRKTYDIKVAERAAVRDKDYAKAETTYWRDDTAAENTWYASTASVDAAFWAAEYDEQATAVAGLAAALGNTPWASFQAAKAATRAAWWSANRQVYLDWIADVNDEYSGYEDLVGPAYEQLVSDTADADVTWTTTTATCIATYDKAMAKADQDYLLAAIGGGGAMLDASLTYSSALAKSTRDGAVAKAAVDLGVSFVNPSTATFPAVKLAYQQTQAAALAKHRGDASAAKTAYVSGTETADTTWTTSVSGYEDNFRGDEAIAYALARMNIASLDAAYVRAEAGSWAASLADLAVADGSPWAQQAADEAAAWRDRVDSVMSEQADLDGILADLDAAFEGAESGAQAARDVDLGEARAIYANNVQAAHSSAVQAQGAAENALAATGAAATVYPALRAPDGPPADFIASAPATHYARRDYAATGANAQYLRLDNPVLNEYRLIVGAYYDYDRLDRQPKTISSGSPAWITDTDAVTWEARVALHQILGPAKEVLDGVAGWYSTPASYLTEIEYLPYTTAYWAEEPAVTHDAAAGTAASRIVNQGLTSTSTAATTAAADSSSVVGAQSRRWEISSARTFTKNDGQIFYGKPLSIEGGQLKLRLYGDGAVVTIPLSDLDATSQSLAQGWKYEWITGTLKTVSPPGGQITIALEGGLQVRSVSVNELDEASYNYVKQEQWKRPAAAAPGTPRARRTPDRPLQRVVITPQQALSERDRLRNWRSLSGHTRVGDFIELTRDNVVRIRGDDGTPFSVALSALSAEDYDDVKKLWQDSTQQVALIILLQYPLKPGLGIPTDEIAGNKQFSASEEAISQHLKATNPYQIRVTITSVSSASSEKPTGFDVLKNRIAEQVAFWQNVIGDFRVTRIVVVGHGTKDGITWPVDHPFDAHKPEQRTVVADSDSYFHQGDPGDKPEEMSTVSLYEALINHEQIRNTVRVIEFVACDVGWTREKIYRAWGIRTGGYLKKVNFAYPGLLLRETMHFFPEKPSDPF